MQKVLNNLQSFNLEKKGSTFSERKFAYESYVLALTAIEEIRLTSSKGEKTIKSLINANESLLKVINQKSYTSKDIKTFVKNVSELQTLTDVLVH